jgi:serine/threonine-protein kinase
MVRVLFITAILLVSFNGHSQTKDRKAKAYYDDGCEKVLEKDLTGAIADFSKAIQLDTGFIQAYENRGVAKFYLDDNRGAIDDYTKALAINPNDYNTYGRRGWAHFHLLEYHEAIADFTKALEGNKNSVTFNFIRGQSEYHIKDYLGAISDFTKVIKSLGSEKEQKTQAYFWRGMAKIENQLRESGCIDLQKAVERGYSEAEIEVHKNCR